MYLALLIVVMVLPIYVLGKFIYNMDNEKEPKKLLKELLFGGVLACILVLVVSYTLGEIIPLFIKDVSKMTQVEVIIYSFICVGLVEEASKLFLLYLTSYNNREFNYTFDMVVYGVFVALGFALLENILYILTGGLITGILRAFTAVPAHASNGAFMGMFLSKAKCYEVTDRKKALKYKILSLVIPTLLHGIYDCLAFSNLLLILIMFITTLFTITIIYVKKKQKEDLMINSYTLE